MNASSGVLPAPAPKRRTEPSIWVAPGADGHHGVGHAEVEVLVAVEADGRVVADLGDQRGDPVARRPP